MRKRIRLQDLDAVDLGICKVALYQMAKAIAEGEFPEAVAEYLCQCILDIMDEIDDMTRLTFSTIIEKIKDEVS